MSTAELLVLQIAGYIGKPDYLASMFNELDADYRQRVFRHKTVLAALWKAPPSALRTRAIREAAR